MEEFEDYILCTINLLLKMVDTEYNIPCEWKYSIIVSMKKMGIHSLWIFTEESLSCVQDPEQNSSSQDQVGD